MSKQIKPKTQPVQRIRHGAVTASIWRNETKRGQMFNVTFQRTYRDGEDWKNSDSFGRRDLLVLSLTASRAFEWIVTQSQKDKRNDSSASGNEPY